MVVFEFFDYVNTVRQRKSARDTEQVSQEPEDDGEGIWVPAHETQWPAPHPMYDDGNYPDHSVNSHPLPTQAQDKETTQGWWPESHVQNPQCNEWHI